jgi:hypothetical protein
VHTRKNYYEGLRADYSVPELVHPELAQRLLADAATYNAMQEKVLPQIDDDYPNEQIEIENREWWPTHCEAMRQGRGNLLTGEYRPDLVYFCQDGPYHGVNEQKEREKHWWALLSQPGVIMTWPIVQFWSEFVHFEWACMDTETYETIAKGTVSWVRRGHRGGCRYKSEQLTFYRDVYAPPELLALVTTAS